MMQPFMTEGLCLQGALDEARLEDVTRIAFYRVVARRRREGKETRLRLRG